MSRSSATYTISTTVGMNWMTVSAVPSMPPARSTQQKSRTSSAMNIGRSGRVRGRPAVVVRHEQDGASFSRSPHETTFCDARRPSSLRVVGAIPARSRKVRIVASRTSPVPSVALDDRDHAPDDRHSRVDGVAAGPRRPDGERLSLHLAPERLEPRGEMPGGPPLRVGAGRPGAELVDERLRLGESVGHAGTNARLG